LDFVVHRRGRKGRKGIKVRHAPQRALWGEIAVYAKIAWIAENAPGLFLATFASFAVKKK
jgi:hypothetical protein